MGVQLLPRVVQESGRLASILGVLRTITIPRSFLYNIGRLEMLQFKHRIRPVFSHKTHMHIDFQWVQLFTSSGTIFASSFSHAFPVGFCQPWSDESRLWHPSLIVKPILPKSLQMKLHVFVTHESGYYRRAYSNAGFLYFSKFSICFN